MKIAILFFMSLLLFSCSNTLDVIDDYHETTIVYCLLNSNDSSQYVRIEKSFLGEGNAYLMAQNADSIYPDSSHIQVYMQKVMNGIPLDSFIRFRAVTDVIKDEGLFVDHPHLVYKSIDDPTTAKKDDYIDDRAIYQLTVINGDKVITSSTVVVKKVVLEPTSPLLYPSTSINLASENPFKTDVTFPVNGKIMNLTVRFNYTEFIIGAGIFENKSLDYVLDDFTASNDNGGQKFTYEILGSKFFAWLKTKIPVDPTVSRPPSLVNLDFIFTVGADDFYNYYSVSNSTALLNDVIPVYSNINGGLGIFSSRVTNIYPAKTLTGESVDSLANGQYTGDLF